MTAPSTGSASRASRPGPSCQGLRRQHGASMIEALIASLLLSILFLGLAHVLSRSLVSQRYMSTQNLALLQMRENLQQANQGVAELCDGSTPAAINVLSSVALTSSCSAGTLDINLAGLERTVPTRSITVSTASTSASQGLFGGDGVIRISD